MARRSLITSIAVLVGAGLAIRNARAEQPKDDKTDHKHEHGEHHGHEHGEGHGHGEGMDKEAMEKMWQQFSMPGEHHKHFAELAGKWKTETREFMTNPDKPAVSYGTAEFTVIMGGRFLKQTYKGEYNGKPFEGFGLTGYDNAKKKYVSIWIDNFGTGIMHSEGQYDPATKTMTEIGESSSPMGDMKTKMVSTQESKDRIVFTMYGYTPEESKMMEIIYTRM